MRFEKLRLTGFKSFVDPTELVIAPGLTGIVGPNGCGKSNVLEALRWVMGETSAKSMRGSGMEDVIFDGAKNRPPRNFAEVSLLVDNSDRTAPPEFNQADTLEIVRRITRDIGSSYKVNGKESRARDIRTLFADASTGAHSPALVRQGRITELINAKPKGRRAILEEAAGVSGLYTRRHEAELRLKAAETNLLRVEDVIGQLESRLSALSRQAKQAVKYRELSAQIRQEESLLHYSRWREADRLASEAEAALEGSSSEAGRAAQHLAEAEKNLLAAQETMPQSREADAVARAVLSRLIAKREGIDTDIERAKSEISRLQHTLNTLQFDISREEALQEDAQKALMQLAEEAAQSPEGEDMSGAISLAVSEAEEALVKVNAAQTTLDADNVELMQLRTSQAALEREAEHARTSLATVVQHIAEANTRQQALAAKLETAQSALSATQTTSEASETALARAEEMIQTADQARRAAKVEEAEARAELGTLKGRLSAIRSEVEALTKLLAERHGTGTPVLDRITVQPGYEAALAAALGEEAFLPVGDEGSGWRTLERLSSIAPQGTESLSAFVSAPPALERRLAHVFIVPQGTASSLHADLAPGQHLVSMAGDLWRWDGVMIAAGEGGMRAAQQLQHTNRMNALKAELAEGEERLDTLQATYTTLTEKLAGADQTEAKARAARQQAEKDLHTAHRQMAEAEMTVTRACDQLERLRSETEARLTEQAGLQRDVEAVEVRLAKAEDPETLAANLSDSREVLEGLRAVLAAKRAEAESLKATSRERQARTEQITRDQAAWQARANTAAERVETLKARLTETEVALKTAEFQPQDIEGMRVEILDQITQAETRQAEAANALSLAENTLRDAEKTEREAGKALAALRESRARLETSAEAARERRADAANRLREETDLSPDKVLAHLAQDPETIPPLPALEDKILKLKHSRERIGAVNLRAEQEAREVEEEHTGLLTEKEDLEAAIAKLRRGLASLNREGRERLLTAFETVNAKFSQLFVTLFGGGSARLELTESDDPLDAGLEIFCSPPGKKLQTLSLLSGGEQTLTALALIFAVFLTNPAPICVLDEVDAPLDDANIERFCTMLEAMTAETETRFILITHHAITMARMDRLFGVTMMEPGVSRLVSVDLSGATTMAAE